MFSLTVYEHSQISLIVFIVTRFVDIYFRIITLRYLCGCRKWIVKHVGIKNIEVFTDWNNCSRRYTLRNCITLNRRLKTIFDYILYKLTHNHSTQQRAVAKYAVVYLNNSDTSLYNISLQGFYILTNCIIEYVLIV